MRNVARGGSQMREVTVKREELLEKVRANRSTHVVAYEEAVRNYKKVALGEIDKAHTSLRNQVNALSEGTVIHLASVHFNLAVPENHVKDYDQVIMMLEMSVDEEVEIRSDEFACYVMDDWDWKEEFLSNSHLYATTVAGSQ